jgi:hypothetical protein
MPISILGDAVGAVDRTRRRARDLAAAVAVEDRVGGEHADEAVEVSLLGGGEEAARELLAPLPRDLEARLRLWRLAYPSWRKGFRTLA